LDLNASASAARCLTDGPHGANIVAGRQPSGACPLTAALASAVEEALDKKLTEPGVAIVEPYVAGHWWTAIAIPEVLKYDTGRDED
jgi:hypothetical protein